VAYYQLNSEKLCPGDVILEAGSGAISAAIKFFDNRGTYSHVFLYVGVNMIMEADEGVRMILASRIITPDPEVFLILRHPDHPCGIESSQWKEFGKNLMLVALQPETNKPYNWPGVFATKLPFLTGRKDSFFCSQLVAEGYRRIGVRLFREDLAPDGVTPNMFSSASCLLKPVSDCFIALPDREWVSEFARNRYEVIKNEPIPLAQISHERSREIVDLFGPRVDKLTERIGKKQHITSPQDLYLTLTFPDLPEADEVSNELVEFMSLRYPSEQISSFIQMTKSSFEQFISMKDHEVTKMAINTLRKDISALEKLIPMLEAQIKFMKIFPPPPLKRRSIHDWIEKKTIESVSIEKEFLNWRNNMLRRMEP
jgi:hypothetical protein